MKSRNILNKRALNLLLSPILKQDSGLVVNSGHFGAQPLLVTHNKTAPGANICNRVQGSRQLSSQAHNKTLPAHATACSLALGNVRYRGAGVQQVFAKQLRLNSSAAHMKREASTHAKQQLADHQDMGISRDSSFRFSELEVLKCSPGELRPKPSADNLLFGHAFTDHMFRVDWDAEQGWSAPVISKLHNLEIHPAAKVLHYAIEAFEGVKAFRGHDNKIRFFRLEQNLKRLQLSAKRLSLPDFDADELMNCIHKLVSIDQDWIPLSQGKRQLTSLYIRPTILGLEPSLGVASSKRATLYVLLSPVGPYFKTGFKPISLYADPDFVRAWPGGAGNSKLGSNYAPTIMVQKKAEKMGLQQVLWLFGDDLKLTEVGTMNIFVSYNNADTGRLHLLTPPLNDGLILPGITRASILDLARQWDDVVVEERYITIQEIGQLIEEKRLVEMFGAGTACIVCPISLIQMKDGQKLRIPYHDITTPSSNSPTSPSLVVNDSHVLTKRILNSITDIQYGNVSHPWAKELRF